MIEKEKNYFDIVVILSLMLLQNHQVPKKSAKIFFYIYAKKIFEGLCPHI